MLRFFLVEYKKGKYVYKYFPETQLEHYGLIELGTDGSKKILKESSKDFDRFYAITAANKITLGEKEGTIAWC